MKGIFIVREDFEAQPVDARLLYPPDWTSAVERTRQTDHGEPYTFYLIWYLTKEILDFTEKNWHGSQNGEHNVRVYVIMRVFSCTIRFHEISNTMYSMYRDVGIE